MEYDYGKKERGRSYEYYNFYEVLVADGHEVELFDYAQRLAEVGKEQMNADLVARAAESRPDVAVFSLYTDQLKEDAVLAIRQFTKTLCFFHDDTWRRDFSVHWAPLFDNFTSSDFEAKRKYENLGLKGLIHFPFGVNERLYKPLDVETIYDVSFVGGWHPYRAWLVNRLRKAGHNVMVAGSRWPGGIVAHDRMVEIFNQSRINLNLSNSTSWDIRYLSSSPRALATHLKTRKTIEQIKARHFEINACRAFQLSYYVDGVERCYALGEEMAVYLDADDLLIKVDYYLKNSDLRNKLADAAYKRTIENHTYSKRFERVFGEMAIQANY